MSKTSKLSLHKKVRASHAHVLSSICHRICFWVQLYIFNDVFFSSLKTSENLEVVKSLPLENLQLETDAPWCEIRATHASATYVSKGQTWAQEYTTVKKPDKWVENCIVKGRNEPIFIQ